MNLLHLQYFYVVAKENGFTKASKVLRIQQPAISRMVKLLEDDVGFKLFEKVGRNVQLTKEGQGVFEHCRKIFGSVEELNNSLGKISGECKGPLYIGASEVVSSHYLPRILTGYLTSYPEVYMNIFSGPASTLFDKIKTGELELGIFNHTPELSDKLEICGVKDVRYHLVINKSLRRRKDIIQKFIGSREIDDTGTKKFPTLTKLRKDYPDASIFLSSNNLTAHKQLVLNGVGVSILPDFLVQDDLKSGSLADLFPNEKMYFEMKFVKRKNSVLSLSAQMLMQECLS